MLVRMKTKMSKNFDSDEEDEETNEATLPMLEKLYTEYKLPMIALCEYEEPTFDIYRIVEFSKLCLRDRDHEFENGGGIAETHLIDLQKMVFVCLIRAKFDRQE